MKKSLMIPLLALMLLSLACSVTNGISQTLRGSGHVTSENRPGTGFTIVDMASSADVAITIGDHESVVVEADDNIVPLIQTSVLGKTLLINTKALTNFTTSNPVKVTITMKSLDQVILHGSANITVNGLNGQDVSFSLPGSGTISASGTANSVTASLSGSGNILCGDLQAKTASVKLDGSGNVTVYASDKVVATIGGSGNIKYRGGAKDVQTNVTGSGNISPEP